MAGLVETTTLPAIEITGLAYDSRQVKEGFLFAALSGENHDGHDFIPQAIANGACAVIGEAPQPDLPVPYLQLASARKGLAQIAARYYNEPTREIPVIGITGTNGKTTTTYLIESILKHAGYSPAVMGTIEYRYQDKAKPAVHTTPESVDMQQWIAEAREHGANALVMEVSSHGLELARIDGCHFDAVLFTNLSQDHLDFHGTMEDYFNSKAKLFTEILPASCKTHKRTYLNWDDSYARRIAEKIAAIRCGRDTTLEYHISKEAYALDGIVATIATPEDCIEIHSSLIGRFNLQNILLAVAACHGLGIPVQTLAEGIDKMPGVPGRMERIPCPTGRAVFVDYAHTPDALLRVLETLREFTQGRLITVFGCGGDRDKEKRPLMGAATARFSDIMLVTSDNPRTEDPDQIIQQILPGLAQEGIKELTPKGGTGFLVETDRHQAIRKAIGMAQPGDVILIAGKGHEDYQIIGTKKRHFDDREEALRACQETA